MFFHAYLIAYFFWLALALGCLVILMIHNLAGGYWGAVLRRPLEAAATTLPLLAVLFIPIIIGMPQLYPWLGGNVAVSSGGLTAAPGAETAILGFKEAYLSLPFFLIRAVVYFVIWIVLALLLVRWSRRRDGDPTPILTARLRTVSAIGLVLMALSISFASIDWLMSTDPSWTSTIWGLIVATGALLSGFAFATLVVTLRSNRPPFSEVASPALFNSLGSFLLAFLMLWAYMSVSQMILFYAGNLPEETVWYVRRTAGGWVLSVIAITVFNFIIPFTLLILRPVKRRPHTLAAVCGLLLAAQFLNLYWLIEPTFEDNTFIVGIITAILGVAIGALWLVVFVWQFGRAPQISPVEPKLIAAREEHEAALAEHAEEHMEQAHDQAR